MEYEIGDLIKVTKLIGADSKRGIVIGHVFQVVGVRGGGVLIDPPIPVEVDGIPRPHILYFRQIEPYHVFSAENLGIPETPQDILQRRLDELDDEILQHALARDEHKRQLKIKKKLSKAISDVIFDLNRKDEENAE